LYKGRKNLKRVIELKTGGGTLIDIIMLTYVVAFPSTVSSDQRSISGSTAFGVRRCRRLHCKHWL